MLNDEKKPPLGAELIKNFVEEVEILLNFMHAGILKDVFNLDTFPFPNFSRLEANKRLAKINLHRSVLDKSINYLLNSNL